MSDAPYLLPYVRILRLLNTILTTRWDDLVHQWLDNWRGVGAIVAGMERQNYDVQFRQYPQGWGVNFSKRGSEDVLGTGWHPAPWVATQQAPWAALLHVKPDRPT